MEPAAEIHLNKELRIEFVHTAREDSELQVMTDGTPPAGSPASTAAMPFRVEEKI
jgi:hypothetical protein